MLKLIGEVVLGMLSFAAVKEYSDRMVTPLPANASKKLQFVQGAKDGVAIGALCAGSALAFPITAPIGAYKVGKAVYNGRREIAEFVKDMPSSAKSTYRQALQKAHSVLGRKDVQTATPSDFASEVANALEHQDFVGTREVA